MNVGSVSTSMVSNESLSSLQGQAGLALLKKANDQTGATVLQLLQALPTPAPSPVEPGQPGALINTYA